MTQPNLRQDDRAAAPDDAERGLGNLDRDFDGEPDPRTLLRIMRAPLDYEAAA